MSFESFFVARIAGDSAEIICKHDSPKKQVKELPSSRNLGIFCFPLGVQHVASKEYMATDVRFHPIVWWLHTTISLHAVPSLMGLMLIDLEAILMQEFTFTLTGGDGRRLHGFCRYCCE